MTREQEPREIKQLDRQPLLLCGKELDFNRILTTGREVDGVGGVKFGFRMRTERFEEIPGSGEGYDVFVARNTIFIAPIGIFPPNAYMHPTSPLMFTAYADMTEKRVVFTMRTKHNDGTYDPRLPHASRLAEETMKFLNANNHEIKILQADFIEPNYTSNGQTPGVLSDNYTNFMDLLNEYRRARTEKRLIGHLPEEFIRQRLAAQVWFSQHVATPLGFTLIDDVDIIHAHSQEKPSVVRVFYRSPNPES